MSKENRAKQRQRAELKDQITRLEARLAAAPNTLAKEKYSKELAEAKRAMQRLYGAR